MAAVRIENRGWRHGQRGSVAFHSSHSGSRGECPHKNRVELNADLQRTGDAVLTIGYLITHTEIDIMKT
jgi:hypothetical protein